MNEHVKRLYDWCHEQRIEALKALELYERGTMRFRVNNVDVTEEQKAMGRHIRDAAQISWRSGNVSAA